MGTLSSVPRLLSDFGDAARVVDRSLFAYGRRIIQENEKAHAPITEDVKENQRQIAVLATRVDTIATEFHTKIDTAATALNTKIDAIAQDVSFLAGRQAERDQPS